MNIKVQCNCGAKFSFDVEPVNGQMPCAITCPQCGADATAAANLIVGQNLSSAQPAAAISAEPPRGLRVAGVASTPKSAAAVAAPSAAPAGQFCSRHPRTPVQSHCYVCGKPICMDCMQVFGYLCSATCRYQAEQQRIQVPPCEFKQSVADEKDWRKIWGVIGAIAAVILLLIGFWGWFVFVGSHPKVYYSLKADKDSWYSFGQFLDPGHVLIADDKQIALHDIDKKTVVWTRSFGKDSEINLLERPKIFSTAENIWVCVPNAIVRMDRKNGEVLKTIPLKEMSTDIRLLENEMLVTERSDALKETFIHIDLATGDSKSEERTLTPISQTVRKRNVAELNPTEGVLLNEELNQPLIVGKEGSQFIAAGDNVVEFQVRMIEEHFNEVQSIKANKGPSKLNENVTAATPVAPVAEEMFNDLARSRNGGYKTVDESRYGVVLRRNSKDIPDWRGEVVGPPFFFPSKTVDVLTAGTGIWIFDKQNKLLKQDKLAHPIYEKLSFGFGQTAPFLEVDGTLYFYDEGVLTAFELPSGNIRWRLPSVRISNVQSDGKGSLYVCTTSASPEDIQYTDQIKLQDRQIPVLMKVDARSGKIFWKVDHLGVGCYLSDKFVYASNVQRGGAGPSLAIGLAQALGSGGGGGSSRFRLSRLDPSSGKELWGYYHEGSPENLDFNKNRILLQYEDKVVVLKFLTF